MPHPAGLISNWASEPVSRQTFDQTFNPLSGANLTVGGEILKKIIFFYFFYQKPLTFKKQYGIDLL